MKIVLVSKCSLDIKQYVEFKMLVLIFPSKSLISSRWVTFIYLLHYISQSSWSTMLVLVLGLSTLTRGSSVHSENSTVQYTNIYCNERLWLKLWAEGDYNCAILLGRSPSAKWRQYYICFIYIIHTFIVHWLVKRFVEKKKDFLCKYDVYLVICQYGEWMCPACLIRAKLHVISEYPMR